MAVFCYMILGTACLASMVIGLAGFAGIMEASEKHASVGIQAIVMFEIGLVGVVLADIALSLIQIRHKMGD